MQVKDGFVLRKVGVQYIVAPTGDLSTEFNGMVRLNETGAYLFEKLLKPISKEDLIEGLANQYSISAEKATTDVEAFLEILREGSILKGGE